MREKFFIKTKFDQKILRKKRGESYDKNKFTAIYLRKSIPPQKRKTTREAGTMLIEAGNQNRRKIS
jgi:hypothetical protein